jgi:phage/plasmid-like protein (TIGR03299 family)
MSHEIDMSNNRANIAYANAVPWHGLGFNIEADASIDEWRKAAGLEWTIERGDISGWAEGPDASGADDVEIDLSDLNRKVLYRSDTLAPLNIVSNNYKVVQPDTILDFIGSTVRAMGWKMETVGSLTGGRKIWALANLGAENEIGKGDSVRGYLLAATACDYSMGSEFMFTGVRVVCANTLACAMNKKDDTSNRVKVLHNQEVDLQKVKQQLGIAEDVWSNYIEQAKRLAATKLTTQKAAQLLRNVFESEQRGIIQGESKRVSNSEFFDKCRKPRAILELYEGRGIGSELKTAHNTAWGLVNAVTQYYDHETSARSTDAKLDQAWFGRGSDKKQEMVDACMELAD